MLTSIQHTFYVLYVLAHDGTPLYVNTAGIPAAGLEYAKLFRSKEKMFELAQELQKRSCVRQHDAKAQDLLGAEVYVNAFFTRDVLTQ